VNVASEPRSPLPAPALRTATPPREQRVVILLADLGGYTRFLLANQLTAVHGQIFIGLLMERLLREVEPPLVLQEIEGDAIFLYAEHPGDDEGWQAVLAQVRRKVIRLFEAFAEGWATATEAALCPCEACVHATELSLKIVVHSGRAVFHAIGGRPQVSGPDVILAHRLLKNTVASREYVLMSDAAYTELGRALGLAFEAGEERYPEIGAIRTHVHAMGETLARARSSLYAMEPAALRAHARRHVWAETWEEVRALLRHLRRPLVPAAPRERFGFALRLLLGLPAGLARSLVAVPRHLLERRAALAAGLEAGGGAR
jgi:hypothetical protein